tara:strand:+ start:223 stop:1776 length:1554 start_codon:yes stop_codon:yes gene_type:complete
MAVSENDLLVGPLTPADGVTLISLDYTFASNAWIVVYKSGSETPLVQDTAYTVAGAGTASGSITLAVAANGIDTYSVYSVVPLERPSDLQARGEFKSDPFNLEFDRVWQAMQGQRTQINRSLKLSLSAAVSAPALLSFTAGATLAIDATGQYIIAGPSATQIATDTATAAQAAIDTAADLVLTNADVVSTNQDTIDTAADLVATNQDTLDTAADLLLTNADAASTAQDAIDTAADLAATNQDTIDTAADLAATAQDVIDAAASESAAATSASNASTSEGNAATSEANAAASFDSFDDRYLGSKASAPTLDNDGNTILEGALYWNATTGAFFVRNGAGEWSGAVFDTAGAMFGANNGSDFDNVVTVRNNLGLGSAAVADAAAFATAAQGTLAGTAVQPASTNTLTNKTLTDPVIVGCIADEVYTITDGAAFEVDPSNGAIQQITLTASRTPAATNFANGETITLRIADGTAYAITWTTMAVVWAGGTAPTLAVTGFTEVNLQKAGGVLRGTHVGDFAS